MKICASHIEVFVLSLTFAFAVHAQHAFVVLTLEEVPHRSADLFIQELNFVLGLLSAQGAKHARWFAVVGLLLTQSKYRVSIAHYGVFGETEAEAADVALSQNLINGVSFIQTLLKLSFGGQKHHEFILPQGQ
jgi:hypothetical protein